MESENKRRDVHNSLPSETDTDQPLTEKVHGTPNVRSKKISDAVFWASLIGFCVIVTILGIAIYLYTTGNLFQVEKVNPNKITGSLGTPNAAPTKSFVNPSPCPKITPPTTIKFLSDVTIQPLSELLNIDSNDTLCNHSSYYSAGIITAGIYEGYKKVIMVGSGAGPYAFLYITTDFKTYLPVIEGPEVTTYVTTKEPFAKTIDVIDAEFPVAIPLPNGYALARRSIYSTSVKTTDNQYKTILQTDFSGYTHLKSFMTSLQFYAYPADGRNYPAKYVGSPYFSDLTGVIVVGPSGLAYSYSLTTPANINIYTSLSSSNPSDSYKSFPTLRLKSQDIVTTTPLYKEYSDAVFDQGCGGTNGDTLVAKTITDADVQKIGTWNGIDIFSLKDTNHVLYQSLYDSIAKPDPQYSNIAIDKSLPSYSAYIAKTPLLFMKDSWGRWDVIAETQYDPKYTGGHQIGGCGKPVMYFYPTKPTEVKVKFNSAMRLDVQIPQYRNGWDVLANPSGLLTDLNQQSSDCNTINTKQLGSEYAFNACQKNQYPYIYWAGQTLQTAYQTPRTGFIVSHNEVTHFMNSTLDNIGFTSIEKQDMLSYWLPKMLAKKAPFYRVAFLQTAQVNTLFPISITPRPDSMYRLFMDWEPLSSKPAQGIPPEQLEKITRTGFFMLEWGGVNR